LISVEGIGEVKKVRMARITSVFTNPGRGGSFVETLISEEKMDENKILEVFSDYI
jgi:hypothetical protein